MGRLNVHFSRIVATENRIFDRFSRWKPQVRCAFKKAVRKDCPSPRSPSSSLRFATEIPNVHTTRQLNRFRRRFFRGKKSTRVFVFQRDRPPLTQQYNDTPMWRHAYIHNEGDGVTVQKNLSTLEGAAVCTRYNDSIFHGKFRRKQL